MEAEAYELLHHHLNEAFKALTEHASEVAGDKRLIQVARLLTQAQAQLLLTRDDRSPKSAR